MFRTNMLTRHLTYKVHSVHCKYCSVYHTNQILWSLLAFLSVTGKTSLQCRRFLWAGESACWNSKKGEKMGWVKRSRVGGREREEKMPARKHCENEKHPLISRARPLFRKWVADQSTPKNYCTGSSLHFW